MRYSALFTFVCLTSIISTACFHQVDDTVGEPEIFSPNLSTEGTYNELLAKPQAQIADSDELQQIVADIYPRLINHLSIFNLHVDLLPSGGIQNSIVSPASKPTYIIQGGEKCEENAQQEAIQGEDIKNLQDRRASFWYDADGDGVMSEGDDWIRLLAQCQDDATNVFSAGTIKFLNMASQKGAIDGALDANGNELAFSDLKVEVRLQSDYNNGQSTRSVLFNRMYATFSRSDSDGVASSSFMIDPGSVSASTVGETQYVFVFDSATVSYNDTVAGEFESIRFSGKYYDSTLDGYIQVNDLVVDFFYYADGFGADNIRQFSASLNQDTDAAAVNDSVVPGTLDFTLDDVTNNVDFTDIFGISGLKPVPMD